MRGNDELAAGGFDVAHLLCGGDCAGTYQRIWKSGRQDLNAAQGFGRVKRYFKNVKARIHNGLAYGQSFLRFQATQDGQQWKAVHVGLKFGNKGRHVR